MRRMLTRGRLVAAGFVCVLVQAAPAWADEYDTLNVDAGVTSVWNDNVFYLPAGVDPNLVLGQSSAGDRAVTSSFGIRLAKPYALQRFELGISASDNKYDRFKFLDYKATNLDAAWRWSLTPRAHGSIKLDRRESLNNFLDFRTFVRNLRKDEGLRFDGEYEIDGVWRVIAAFDDRKVTNEQLIVQQQDFRATTSEMGIKYAFTSGSSVSAVARTGEGRILKLDQPILATLIDNRYKTREYEARLFWLITGKSQLDARLAHYARMHPNFGQRDFQGFAGEAKLTWGLSGKSRLQIVAGRDLNSFLSTSTSYTRLDRLSIGPIWEIGAKVVARGSVEYSSREFLGAIAVTPQNGRIDVIRSAQIGIDWQPFRWATLSTQIRNDRRTSNLPGIDFNSTTTVLSAQVTF